MFKRSGFAFNYLTNMARTQYRGMMRYSGEYNLLFFTITIVLFDNYLEGRIRKDLMRNLTMQRTFDRIR
jgi:hypothetical protein